MAERTIGLGDTSSFRYIGIEPPLDVATTNEIVEQIVLPDWVDHNYVYRTQQGDSDGPAYTELGFDVGNALDWLGTESVNEGAIRVATQVANLLRVKGDSVAVIDGIYPIDCQAPIFSSGWAKMSGTTK